MSKLFFIIFLLPLYAFGASNGSGEYDIIPRTINFLIFVAILYYFVATPFKNFYKNRIVKISSKLDEIQKKLLESKAKKLDTMKKLEEAKASGQQVLVLSFRGSNPFTPSTSYFIFQRSYMPRSRAVVSSSGS